MSIGFYLVTGSESKSLFTTQTILYIIYFLVFIGGFIRAFFGPTIFSLVALDVKEGDVVLFGKWELF